MLHPVDVRTSGGNTLREAAFTAVPSFRLPFFATFPVPNMTTLRALLDVAAAAFLTGRAIAA